jgi:uncharacterized protein (DUF427 family)
LGFRSGLQCGLAAIVEPAEEARDMKAIWHGRVIAESDKTIELDGYHYFPSASVRSEFLQPAPRTAADHRCPHGVQFFNISYGADSSERSAWTYEAPRASHAHVAHWIGFWNDVELQS